MNGSCSPASFGGSCIGTPKECKDCSSVTRCDDSAEQEQELEQNGQSWEVTREVSLVKKVADGIACITTCDNWPYKNCKVRSNYQYQLNFVHRWSSGGARGTGVGPRASLPSPVGKTFSLAKPSQWNITTIQSKTTTIISRPHRQFKLKSMIKNFQIDFVLRINFQTVT